MSSTISQPSPTPLAAPSAIPDTPDAQALAALLHRVAVAPLADRGWIRITGEDRVRWLNGMVTNSVAGLAPGAGCYNLFLNAQGQIQGDGYIFQPAKATTATNPSGLADASRLTDASRLADASRLTDASESTNIPEAPVELLLQTAATQIAPLLALLDRFVIMDDVELSDVSADREGLLLAGPGAPQLLAEILGPAAQPEASAPQPDLLHTTPTPDAPSLPSAPDSQPPNAPSGSSDAHPSAISAWPTAPITLPINIQELSWRGANLHLVHAYSPLVPRIELWGPSAAIAALHAELRARAVVPATPLSLTSLRVLEGTPLFGVDIRGRELPQETAQSRALHFSKGCYLGQEIVERIRSRGKVNRTFSGFILHGDLPTLPGEAQTGTDPELLADGKSVGVLTTVAELPPGALLLSAAASGPAVTGSAIRIALGYIRRDALDRQGQPDQHRPLTYAGGHATPSPLPFPLLPVTTEPNP